jgi:TetR/AcrR family fatty acid metabolism transcriptional regulator
MAQAEKSRASEKRERILEGALRAFAKKGFYNTKVSEIANEAGVADGTIYLYFKNKDDLLISLFEDRMVFLIDRLQSELEAVGGGVLDQLRCVVEMHFQLAIEEPELAEFITVELRQSSKFVKEYENPKFHDYLHVLASLITRGQEEGVLRSDVDRRVAARALFGSLDEVLLFLTLSKSGAVDVSEEARQVADIFISGLVKR